MAPALIGLVAITLVYISFQMWLRRAWVIAEEAAKKAILAEQDSRDLLVALIDVSFDAVIVIDEVGTIVEWSKTAETVFGAKRSETIGKNSMEFVKPTGDLAKISQTERAERLFGKSLERRTMLIRTGELVPIEISAVKIVQRSGRVLYASYSRPLTAKPTDTKA